MSQRTGYTRPWVIVTILCITLLGGAQANWPIGTQPHAIANSILFVTQVPNPNDFTTIASVFGNQRGDLESVPRGGDLWIRYPDGTLKNLTASAGFGMNGFQGAKAIAVRDPAVSWDGTKAIFSMVVGAPARQYQIADYYWQLYEITGLGKSNTPHITKVAHQPVNYNNVSPIYGSDDRIIFTSDRPRDGQRGLYPQRDEYEEAPTNTGLWRLDPKSGALALLDHAPSGDFTPMLDSYGRVIFTRWDHLQRDQQADSDVLENAGYGTFNYASESPSAARLSNRNEVYPEPRGERKDLLKGTNLEGHTFNQFFPWQINEDGTEAETLNHIGRHELHSYFDRSLNDDPNLKEFIAGGLQRFNPNPIENFLQIKEDPAHRGTYFGVDAPEFSTHAAGQIVSIQGPPNLTADKMAVTYVTPRATADYNDDPPSAQNSGHYREPLPLADGTLIAVHSPETRADQNDGTREHPRSRYAFRLKTLKHVGNYWTADQPLTAGISKSVTYWDPDAQVSYSGPLWELNPVEVRARTRPALREPILEAPEQHVFDKQGVTLAQLQAYLRQHNLALVVTRNVTTRDIADRQQPFNLQVAGSATKTIGAPGKTYLVAFLQFFEADLLRGLGGTSDPRPGRRVLAQPLHDPAVHNIPAPGANGGSVAIAADGSMAAFVPAQRAMTWALEDSAHTGVVRERYWLTFQPGEVRVCASCHGLNTADQAHHPEPTNDPAALAQLLEFWKKSVGPQKNVYVPGITR